MPTVVVIALLAIPLSIVLAGWVLYRSVPLNRVWSVLLVLTLPISSVTDVGAVSANLALSDAVLVALMVYGLVVASVSKQGLRLPFIGLTAALFGWVAFSMLVGINRFGDGADWLYVISLLKYISLFAYFIATVNLSHSRDDLSVVLRAWLVASTVIAGLGVAGSFLHFTAGQSLPFVEGHRATGTFDDANLFAAYLSLSFFLAFALLIDAKTATIRARMVVVSAMALQLLALVLSGSRGGVTACVLSIAVFGVISGSGRIRLALVGTALAGVVVVGSLAVSSQGVIDKFQPVINRLASASDFDDPSHLQRYRLWSQALAFFERSPVTGIGRGNFKVVLIQETGIQHIPHNTFLGILAETGLVGLLLFLGLLLSFVVLLAPRIFQRVDRTQALMAACLLAALVAIAAQGLTISLENFRGFWVLLGLIYVFHLLYPVGSRPSEAGSADLSRAWSLRAVGERGNGDQGR
ncbi:MAG: O-antigen ligase family protein [Nitrospirae bacterium]|nr:O-antigen ligase family protein [Nitrospirota bacterium]